jgi:hypothetical protein
MPQLDELLINVVRQFDDPPQSDIDEVNPAEQLLVLQ